jgi:putative ABC transport system permease protein
MARPPSRWRMVLRGIRWRGAASSFLLAVAAVAVLAAAAGPLYLARAEQSILDAVLDAAPAPTSGLTLLAPPGPEPPLAAFERATATLPSPGRRPVYGAPIYGGLLGATGTVGPVAFKGSLLARTGICSQLVFHVGACPVAADQVALSTRSAAALHVGTGARLSLAASGAQLSLVVSGLYEPPAATASYWWGNNYFGFGQGGIGARIELDALVVPFVTLSGLPPGTPVAYSADVPLLPSRLTVGDVQPLLGEIGSYANTVQASDGLAVSTGLSQLAAQAAHEHHLMAVVVAAVVVQLVLLAVFVLYTVVARTNEARAPDVALARLRGYSPLGAVWLALREPLVLVAIAAPVGLALAWFAVAAIGALALPGGLVGIGGDTILAVLATVAGAALAVVVAARSLLVDRGVDGRAARPTRRGRLGALAGDAVAVVLAGAGLLELFTTGGLDAGRTSPLAVLAPGLLALAIGVVAVRLAPPLGRLALGWTSGSGRVATFLALRQVFRRLTVLRQILLVTLALALVSFALASFVVSSRNRAVRAAFEVGAARVLTVDVPTRDNLLDLVRQADPGGRSAMAVEEFSSPSGVTLGVDASRLAAVATWPAGLSGEDAAAVGRYLSPRVPPVVSFRGDSLAVVLDVRGPLHQSWSLSLNLFDQALQQPYQLPLGNLVAGLQTLRTPLYGGCADGCRLESLAVAWNNPSVNGPQTATLDARLLGMVAGSGPGSARPVDLHLGEPGSWAGQGGASVLGTAGPPGGAALALRFTDNQSTLPATAGPVLLPPEIPAVVTGQLASLDGASPGNPTIPVQGLDGNTLNVAGRIVVPALPRVGADASLVDLDLLERAQTDATAGVTDEVWLAARASPAIEQKLEAEGVSVVASQSASVAARAANRGGVALAYQFFLYAAGAAALLAVGTTLFTVAASARRRRGELAALQAAGVPARVLYRAALLEQVYVLGAGIVLGVGAGVLASALAVGSLPEFSTVLPGPPLQLGLPLGLLGALAVAATIVLLLVATAATRGFLGRLSPALLRAEQE